MAKLLLLLLPLAALTHASNIQDCGSEAHVDLSAITVTGCGGPTQPCIFHKGSNAAISLPFTPTYESASVKAEVFGIVAGVPVPFSLDNPNACSSSGITCPVVAGETYTYQASLPVKNFYPSISLEVKWELKDGDKTLVCILIPVKLV